MLLGQLIQVSKQKKKSSSNKKQFVNFSGRKTRNKTINMRSQMYVSMMYRNGNEMCK